MILPTGKEHISFSELSSFLKCSHQHYLGYVKNLRKIEETTDTCFGHAIHNANENYARTREMRHEIAFAHLIEGWKKNNFDKLGLALKQAENILDKVPVFMDSQFPNWEFIEAEDETLDPIPNKEYLKFKYYIDLVIKSGEYYYLLDWKTSRNGWNDYKKKDKIVKKQLELYASFWSKRNSIDLDRIRVAFIILNRDFDNQNTIEYYPLNIEERHKKNSLKILNDSLSCIEKGLHFKVWKYSNPKYQGVCRFCEFNKTEYCP